MAPTYSGIYTTPCQGVKPQNFGQKTAKFLKNSENDGHKKSFHIYGRMVMGSHQKPGFDDIL